MQVIRKKKDLGLNNGLISLFHILTTIQNLHNDGQQKIGMQLPKPATFPSQLGCREYGEKKLSFNFNKNLEKH